jgi:anti-sigma factor RsiW
MRCAWVQERLLLYLAGELEPGQAPRLLRHLERCAACVAMAEQLAETGARLETALPTTLEAPATLHDRVMDVVRGSPAPRRSWPAFFPRPRVLHRLAHGAAVLGLMATAFFGGRWDAVRSLPVTAAAAPTVELALLGTAHRQSLRAGSVSEVKEEQPQQLSRRLAPLLPFPIAAVDLPAEGLRLVGGKTGTMNGVPVAVLHYEWQGKRVTLFQMDARRLSPPALRAVVFRSDSYFVRKMDGLTYVTWPFGQTRCVMVAQAVPMHLLFQLACHASEKLERA